VVYHYISHDYGLEALARRRLKVSDFRNVNDPYELLPFICCDRVVRTALNATKRQLGDKAGLVCFSRTWQEPLMWANYANRHEGVCLGFEVTPGGNKYFKPVTYIERQIVFDDTNLTKETTAIMISQKYSGWSYEQEIRLFTTRTDRDPDSGLEFVPFGQILEPSVLFVGYMNHASDEEIFGVIGNEYRERLKIIRVKPCCHEFRMIDPNAQHIFEPAPRLSRAKRKEARRRQVGGGRTANQ